MKTFLSLFFIIFLFIKNFSMAENKCVWGIDNQPVLNPDYSCDNELDSKLYKVDPSVNKKIIIPLYVHIVDISKFDFKTITSIEDIKNDIIEVNKIWKQINIEWLLQDVNYTKPNLIDFEKDRAFLQKNCNFRGACDKDFYSEKYKKTKEFDKSPQGVQNKIYHNLTRAKSINSTLKKNGLNVFYLPKMVAQNICGISYIYKNENKRRLNGGYAIVGDKCRHNRSRTLAHELGHLLGLSHSKKSENLMYIGLGKKGSELSQRKFAQNWIEKYYFTFVVSK